MAVRGALYGSRKVHTTAPTGPSVAAITPDVLETVIQAASSEDSPHDVLSRTYETLLDCSPIRYSSDGIVVVGGEVAQRKVRGSFFTATAVARLVVDAALGVLAGGPVTRSLPRVVDPAMGTGVFLMEAVRQIAAAQELEPARVAERCAFGYDVDSMAVEIAILALWLETGGRPSMLMRHLRCQNILEYRPARPARFDVVVGNPPWGARFHKEERGRIAARWQASSAGSFDSFKVFLQLATELSSSSIGMIVPQAVLAQSRHADVRALLLEHHAPYRAWVLQAGTFPGAVAPACVLVLGPKPGPELLETSMRVAAGETRTIPAHLWTRARFPLRGESLLDLRERLLRHHPSMADVTQRYRIRDVGINYNRASVGARVLYSGREPEDLRDIPRYRGRNFTRYGTVGIGGWLRYDARRQLRPGENLSLDEATYGRPEKIVFRQTADRIVATMDRSRMAMGRSVIAVTDEGDGCLLAVLACLNSRLFTALYRAVAGEEGRVLAQVKVGTLLSLPLPAACLDTPRDKRWAELGVLAEGLLAAQGVDIQLDARIEQVVRDLYGLARDEMEMVGPRAM